jgi:hypothetical protein
VRSPFKKFITRFFAVLVIFLAIAPASSISQTLYFCAMSDGYREQCCCKPKAAASDVAEISSGQCAKSIDIKGLHQVYSAERSEKEIKDAGEAWLCEHQHDVWSQSRAKQVLYYDYQQVPIDKRTLRIFQCTWLI